MSFASIKRVTGNKVLEQERDGVKQTEYRAPLCSGRDTAHVFEVNNIKRGWRPWSNHGGDHQMPRDPLYSFGKYLSGPRPPPAPSSMGSKRVQRKQQDEVKSP